MPTIENTTPFPHLLFANTDTRGLAFGVLIVKAAFDVGPDGGCVVADEQESFNFTDATHGALNQSSLRHPSDLVSYKPATDIIVDAVAHSPDAIPAESWIAGLRIEDERGELVERKVRVSGPRQWEPRWLRKPPEGDDVDWRSFRPLFRRWRLSVPDPIDRLPVRYEYAYGGTIARGQTEDGVDRIEAFEANPVGCGWVDPEWTDHTKPQSAPQIEDPDDPILDALTEYEPAGLGPIPPAWLPRRPLGGTFDERWKQEIWPKWPPDYDYRYNNSAPRALTHAPHLSGALRVNLSNLRRGASAFSLAIPNATPIAGVLLRSGERRYVEPAMDTVFLELASDDLFDWRVQVTWRLIFNRDETVAIILASPSEADRREMAEGPRRAEASPHPNDCATETDLLEVTA